MTSDQWYKIGLILLLTCVLVLATYYPNLFIVSNFLCLLLDPKYLSEGLVKPNIPSIEVK